MTESAGVIALVGSGEYLPVMQEIESQLLADGVARGGASRFVQLATAAGQEGKDRLDYWRRLGEAQAERIGAEPVFLPVFNRADAERADLAAQVEGAGLIYLSGGDPGHLADSLRGTAVGEAILTAWRAGSSLAGCSAGAMALGKSVPHVRGLPTGNRVGLAAVPHIQTIPHYDRFFSRLPDRVTSWVLAAEPGQHVLGIDEDTAAVSRDGRTWDVVGRGKVHWLHGGPLQAIASGGSLTL